jgi:hypothetical protein
MTMLVAVVVATDVVGRNFVPRLLEGGHKGERKNASLTMPPTD